MSERMTSSILSYARFAQVSHQFVIESHAALAQGVVIFSRGAQHVSRLGAIAPPPGTLAALEIAPTYERAQELLLKLTEGR